MRIRDKYKPAVTKAVLLFFAGALWLGVGVMLLFLAASWLLGNPNVNRSVFVVVGVVLALFAYYFGFLKIVDKNLARILPVEEKRCLFAFMPWKSYLIIPIMIALGMILRHSGFPKPYLAIIYTGIGLALILSSVKYARVFLREIRGRTLA